MEAFDFLYGKGRVFVVVQIAGDDCDQWLEGLVARIFRIKFGDKIVEGVCFRRIAEKRVDVRLRGHCQSKKKGRYGELKTCFFESHDESHNVCLVGWGSFIPAMAA